MICVTFPNFIADQKQRIASDCERAPNKIAINPFLSHSFILEALRNGIIKRNILKQVVLDIAIPKVEEGIKENAVFPLKWEKEYISAESAGTR